MREKERKKEREGERRRKSCQYFWLDKDPYTNACVGVGVIMKDQWSV